MYVLPTKNHIKQNISKVVTTDASIPPKLTTGMKIDMELFRPMLSDNMPEIEAPTPQPQKKMTFANTKTYGYGR